MLFCGGIGHAADDTCRIIQAQSWKGPPWHLAATWYDIAQPTELRSLAMTVEVEGDFTSGPPGKRIFVAPLFGKIGGAAFYLGLQTDVGAQGVKGFLFSRWGRVHDGDARPAPGGWHRALTNEASREGDFVGVRVAYPWTAGRHTFTLSRGESDAEGTWIGLTVRDHQTGRTVDVGSLRFPGGLALGDKFSSFVELYGGDVIEGVCRTTMPATGTVRLGAPMVNGSALDMRKSRCSFVKEVPPLAAITRSRDEVQIAFGRAVGGERCLTAR
ncbi:MAG: hypothetical protein HQL38_08560 [Alphaproteobacteria bacterium]|nr:hypothetical protein [Alphaproteobacteria bacterium]